MVTHNGYTTGIKANMTCSRDYSTTLKWKEGNVLFYDALNTFYLWLYGIGHMVKHHSDSVSCMNSKKSLQT